MYSYVYMERTIERFTAMLPVSKETAKMIHVAMVLLAVFMSFRYNGGFDLVSFIVALIFPYIYVLYKLATAGIAPLGF